MNAVEVEPISGKRVLFPPGRVAIRLDERHRRAYRRLYGLFFPLAGVPELRDDDFDGHALKFTRRQLAALNHAFAGLGQKTEPGVHDAFGGRSIPSRSAPRRCNFCPSGGGKRRAYMVRDSVMEESPTQGVVPHGSGYRAIITSGDRRIWSCSHVHFTDHSARTCAEQHVGKESPAGEPSRAV